MELVKAVAVRLGFCPRAALRPHSNRSELQSSEQSCGTSSMTPDDGASNVAYAIAPYSISIQAIR